MQVITSKDNELVKNIKKLKEKKYREINNEFVIEGIKLIEEAINEKANIKQIVICDNCNNSDFIPKDLMYEIAKYNCLYVDVKVFYNITEVKNQQGILVVIEKNKINKEIDYNEDILVILDDIQDPGNLGTILRTIDSTGLSQVIVSKKSGDVFNPKVVRSSMGAIFRINVIEADNIVQKIKEIKKHKFEILVTSLDTDDSIYDIKYTKKAIVIGNEANGVSKEVQEIADKKVKIPMLGKTESLNASVATGIMIYEYVRQRQNNMR